MTLLQIAVAAPLDQLLTYSVSAAVLHSEDIENVELLIGRRVLVPLGGRKVTGYVISADPPAEGKFKIRDILQILDSEPLFHSNILPLFQWIARYYHYPIGEVIKAALPGGLSPKSIKHLEISSHGCAHLRATEDGSTPDWLRNLMESGKLSPKKSREVLSSKTEKKYAQQLLREGVMELRESVAVDSVREKLEVCYTIGLDLPENNICSPQEQNDFRYYQKAINCHAGLTLKLSEAKTIYYLHELTGKFGTKPVPRKELLSLYAGASKALHSLIESGIIEEENTRVFRSPLGEQLEFFPAPERLTDEQQKAMDEIGPAITKGEYAPFLLHGVTGSGKTEVYLQAAAATLACDRSVLIIVPEIALATQLEAHFISRFGDNVVLLHSGLSASEKFDQWSLALSGQAQIVIGARSAIFAPLEKPGLIVVDEEHDGGLKQDDSLRYNGRDLAVVRAKQQGAVVLLASATPSVVSYSNALSGKYRLLTMKKRVGDRPLPKVHLIDLRQKIPGQKKSLFRPPLRKALEDNLQRGKQSVILINRRGFSANVICQECGAPVECKHCHVSLTLHKSKQQLLCHYCGYSVHEKTVCSKCNSLSMVPVGFGTERVEEELRALLPEARIARLDTDTASDRKEFLLTLKKMRAGDIDVMVGTQMVAKGHHFPGVTLVGVVWADGGLSMPDYRAAEKTFQLVTQVTGRAGRGDDPGEVYIQTMRPEHYAIQYARGHKYSDLVEKELELRKNPQFPPYVRIVSVHIQGESESVVQKSAARIAAACRSITAEKKGEVEILGPAPSPLDRLRKNFRWQVMIKSASFEALHSVCSYIRMHQNDLSSGKCKVMLDIDPENMM
jgi:primosomal protein N' (replication factor Y)